MADDSQNDRQKFCRVFDLFFYEPVATEHQSHLLVWRLVTHSNKVYKIVNDARYIILIFIHCCTVPPPPLFNPSSPLWVNWVTPAAGEDFSSACAKLSNVLFHIIFSTEVYLSVCVFLGSSIYLRYSEGFLLTEIWTERLQKRTRSGTSWTQTSCEMFTSHTRHKQNSRL